MLKNERGFSLVELMIVVAIIGILAAIAIPNFQKFQEKAKQTEAKTSLAGLYTAEAAFYAEYSSYGARLDEVGFAPSGNVKYATGFSADYATIPAGAPTGTTSCIVSCSSATAAPTCATGFASGWTCALPSGSGGSAATVSAGTAAQNTFLATAVSYINQNSSVADTWSIDNVQNLQNVTSGL